MSSSVSEEVLLQRAISLARCRGAEVSFQEIALERAVGLTVQGRSPDGDLFTQILIDPRQPKREQAFLICHELGHLELHTDLENVIHIDGPERGDLEEEADRFAEKLLKDIKRELEQNANP